MLRRSSKAPTRRLAQAGEPGRLRDRPPAAGRAQAGRAQDLRALHRRRGARRRAASRARLNDQGKLATIDVLGEEIAEPDEARAIAAAYREAFEAIERGRLDSNVSVKPTALGLKLGYELFRENLLDVVRHAAERGNFVRIDMEDSSTTDDTLRLYRELRAAGHENVGVVLQARLKRTLADLARARRAAAERSPLQGHLRRAGGDRLPRLRLDPRQLRPGARGAARAGCYVGIATHDEWLLEQGQRLVAARGARARASTSSRCCSACGRRSATSSWRGPPAADLHAVREALVRVLAAAAAGEPEDRRLHRRRHGRPAPARPQRPKAGSQHPLRMVRLFVVRQPS